jgi:TolB-like protein
VSRLNPITFFRELRRRRIAQVVLIYAAAAGGVISACDWIFPQIPELVAQPERALRWVIIAAIASGPLALIFGWLYDVTTEGIGRTASFSEAAHDPDTSLHRVDRWVIGGLSAAFIGIVAVATLKISQLERLAPPAVAEQAKVAALDPMALAVLPFLDRSADGENAELLAFGMHDTLLSVLSHLSGVRVMSRTTMEHYQGTSKPLPEIARELGAANLVEGSVQRVGNLVRVTVQLVRAPGDEHVWAEVYDRELTATNLFEIQTEIAREVAAQLAVALSPDEERRLAIIPTANTEAYTAYMLGRQRLRDRKVEAMAQAVEQFARAIELDPNYAAAYSGLVDACYLHRTFSGGHVLAPCPKDAAGLEALVRKGLAIDDTVGDLWVSLGNLLADKPGGGDDAELEAAANAAFEKGLQLSPSHSQGYHWYAMYLGPRGKGLGGTDPDLGVNIALKGLGVDPLSLPLNYLLSYFYDVRHQFDESFRYARRLIEIAPDSPRGHERLAELEGGVHGRMDKLILGEMHAARLDPRHLPYWEYAGWAHMNLGDYDMALRYYEKAASLAASSSWNRKKLDLKRAVALLHLGQRETAIAIMRQAMEGGLTATAFFVADLELQNGRARDALGILKSMLPQCFDGDSVSTTCWKDGRLRIAQIYQQLGRPAEMQKLGPDLLAGLEKDRVGVDVAAWRLGWGHPVGILDVQILAVLGRRERALDALEQAVDQGWLGWAGEFDPTDLRYEKQFDSLLNSIRGDPRFEAAFARIEADLHEQLEIVREMERRGEIPSRDDLPEPKFEE